MRYAILKGGTIDNLIEAAPETIGALAQHLGADGYIEAPIEDRRLWALGVGVVVEDVASAREAGQLKIDADKIGALRLERGEALTLAPAIKK